MPSGVKASTRSSIRSSISRQLFFCLRLPDCPRDVCFDHEGERGGVVCVRSWKLVRCPKCYCPFSAVSKPIFATNGQFAACVKIYKIDIFASLESKACSFPEFFRRISENLAILRSDDYHDFVRSPQFFHGFLPNLWEILESCRK